MRRSVGGSDSAERSDANTLWQKILKGVQTRVSDRTFRTWFQNTRGLEIQGHRLLVSVPNEFFREWLGEHFSDLIRDVLADLQTPLEVEYVVNGSPTAKRCPRVLTFHPASRIQRRFIFSNFVVGNHNQLAYSAAIAVARDPLTPLYNPLLFFGRSGLGKSHLLHAIGNYILENFPHLRIFYTPAENLMNELIYALRNDQMADFRRKFRSLDVLLIDDIQFLRNKNMLQEELVYTLNFLQSMNKRIVLTSDRHPRDIPTLSPSLVSRLQGGLIIEIGPPDLEARIEILRVKAEEVGLRLSRKVLLYIAERVRDNIRELEGCINRLKAAQTLLRKELTFETVREILEEFVRESPPPSPDDVIRMASRVFRVRVRDLVGKRRHAPIVRARHAVAYILHSILGYSLEEVGRHLGKRDHSTILNSVRKAQALLQRQETFREQVGKIQDLLGLR